MTRGAPSQRYGAARTKGGADLLRPDGTARHVSYLAPSGARSHAICISVVTDGKRKTTTYGVGTSDFYETYGKAMRFLADVKGFGLDSPEFCVLMSTADAFLAANGLKLKTIKVLA